MILKPNASSSNCSGDRFAALAIWPADIGRCLASTVLKSLLSRFSCRRSAKSRIVPATAQDRQEFSLSGSIVSSARSGDLTRTRS
jgi:hypothetical protein